MLTLGFNNYMSSVKPANHIKTHKYRGGLVIIPKVQGMYNAQVFVI